ncbi:MAG: beta-galactosidase [Planctomycetota bacterium]
MPDRYPPINPKCPHFLHGGDYNPDQWPEEVWPEDMHLMELAHCNAMSVGIFAWTRLEPEEGRFDFGWLDRIMDMLAENDAFAVLATPSGARPAWMSAKYQEVLRVRPDRGRNLHGLRHNHCFTSPIYREKCRIINTKLAERYKDHPALLVWHISNEYGGECHCDLCREAFREWLKLRYNSLDALNHAWWAAFWSHTYTDWLQVEPPSPVGETCVHGLNLDWKRFVTDQTTDFMKAEIAPLKKITPHVPVTTNFMGTFPGLNYWRMAKELDVISWDNYPQWHNPQGDATLASEIAFVHDINRCLKGGKPFMLMESTPSMTNWMPVAKLKRPGMHMLSSLQAVAHGSDTVQYFQWRKSRGSSEKFHGAVVDHCGHENNRVFRDVAEVGKALERLDPVIGTTVRPDVAVIYDWENAWAIQDAQGPRREKKDYLPTCRRHYRQFWRRGVPVDVIDMDQDLSSYKLVIAPMLHMVRRGVAERIEKFVKGGGTFVTTYWSGIVDEHDLCFLGGFPGPLRRALGVWDEEIDALYDPDRNHVVPVAGNPLGLAGEYEARDLCALIHAEAAAVLAAYKSDFYAGRPALTVNHFGKGKAYYIASRNDDRFLSDFYGALIEELRPLRALAVDLPPGVTAQLRTDGERRFVFLLNFNAEPVSIALGGGKCEDLLTGKRIIGTIDLDAYGAAVLAD